MQTSQLSLIGKITLGILFGLACITGCGGGGQQLETPPDFSQPGIGEQPPAEFVNREVALDSALQELEQLETPFAADPAEFAMLKDEFARILQEYYGGTAAEQQAARRASGLTPEQMSQAWCAQASVTGGTTGSLRWRGRHTGDYDLNGVVSVSDLTPLGFMYGASIALDADGLPLQDGNNEWARQVDGDENGLLTVADLTPIGFNYESFHAGYRVYLGRSTNGTDFTWDANYLPNPADPGAAVTLPFNSSKTAGDVLQYSLQFTVPALLAGEVLFARVVPYDGSQEGTATVTPVHDGPHASFLCETCHNVTDYSFRGTDGLCDICHPQPPEDHTSSWADTPGLHSQCMMCHTSHGFAISPPESVCSNCHTDRPSPEHYGGQTDCLGCHQQPHLPVVDIASGGCMGCHPTPPEDDTLLWSQAPGLHNSCLLCHPGSHPDKPVPAESVCGTCHADIVAMASPAKKLECLICHDFAHVPTAQPQPETCQTCHTTEYDEFQLNAMASCFDCHMPHAFEVTYEPTLCQQCHLTPPEDETALWADAPGLHNQCSNCHDRHGFVVADPDGICANCHQSQIDGGHAGGQLDCLTCHGHPHLPQVGAGSCESCHPTPPEDETALWTDAPGMHGDCLQCHPGEHPDKPVPPESICANCHTDKPNPGHGGGLSTCLDCHQFAHLPVTDLAQMDCQVCHPTPPEDVSALWADAPGLHAQCLSCHPGPEHGIKPVPAEGICDSCHAAMPNPGHTGGLSTCLDCHFVPHLPNTDITQLNCKGCHPVPPERPSKEWGDAPGLHDQCFECHDQPDHGFAPDPTRAFCKTCHSENHGGSNACINCHLYEHVPTVP